MNQHPNLSLNDTKYRNARCSLLTIVLLSVLNVFSMIFAETYFLFSAYLPQSFVYIGYDLAAESGDNLFLIVAGVMAVIVLIPYLLCWIFSKKRVGWMVGALCLFALDSVLFFFDFIAMIQVGEYGMIIDVVIRIWAIVSLILGVKYGFAAKKDTENAPIEIPAPPADIKNKNDALNEDA